MVMKNQLRLRLGAILHFLVAIGHFVCLFFLEDALKTYGIWELMEYLCFGHVWILYVLTVSLTLDFALAGVYALSASGDIAKLPLQRWAILAIIGLYGIRTVVGTYALISNFSYLQFFSTLIPAILVWCYWPGLCSDKKWKKCNETRK